MKMTLRDKVIVLILMLGLICYGGYKALWLPGMAKTAELEAKKVELEGLTVDITPLLKQTENLQTEEINLLKKVNEFKSGENSLTLKKEDFLMFLGNSSVTNRTKVLRFNDLGMVNDNNVWRVTFDFELQGTAHAINNILSDIEKIGIKYSVGSVSYRQVKDYPYLKRFFDEHTNLPWYKYEKPQEPETEEIPEEDSIINDSISNTIPNVTVPEVSQIIPLPTPIPKTPTEVPQETPTPAGENESITENPDNLIEQTNYAGTYKVQLLNNDVFDIGNEMRIAVTLQFVMVDEPSLVTSFIRGDIQ